MTYTTHDEELPRPAPTRELREPADETPDRVAEASMESFPASDPPAWNPIHIGPPTPTSVSTIDATQRSV